MSLFWIRIARARSRFPDISAIRVATPSDVQQGVIVDLAFSLLDLSVAEASTARPIVYHAHVTLIFKHASPSSLSGSCLSTIHDSSKLCPSRQLHKTFPSTHAQTGQWPPDSRCDLSIRNEYFSYLQPLLEPIQHLLLRILQTLSFLWIVRVPSHSKPVSPRLVHNMLND